MKLLPPRPQASLVARSLTAGLLVSLASALAVAQESKPAKVAKRPDLALLVGDEFFLALEVGRSWHGPEAGALKKASQAHPMIPTWETRALDKLIGVGVDDLERVVLIAPKLEKLEPATLLTARKPFERKKVLAALAPGGKESKVGARAIVTSADGALALHWINDHTLLLGKPVVVRAFLERRSTKGASAFPLAIEAAANKSLFALAMKPATFSAVVEGSGATGKPYVPLFKARSWQVVAEADKELALRFRLEFPNEETAKAGLPALRTALGQLDRYLALSEKEGPAFLDREGARYPSAPEIGRSMAETIKATRAAIKAVKVEQQGNAVHGTFLIKARRPATAFLLLLTLAPRPAKGPEKKD